MTQELAQEIITKAYGNNAYAIGHTENCGVATIFWIYEGETEDDYKVHRVEE